MPLLHSPRMDVLLAEAAAFVRAEAAQGEVLVLGATSAAADDFARAVCDGALVGLHRRTPQRLAAELAISTLTAKGLVPIPSAMREALAARVIDQARAAGSLSYFAPVSGM